MTKRNHWHRWRTRYVTIEGVDCASGMQCECGVVLNQDLVEGVINSVGQVIFPIPCPFCGESREIKEVFERASEVWWVTCVRCGGRGGAGLQKAHAVKAWNERNERSDDQD